MENIKSKIPIVLEFVLNGSFILVYSLYNTQKKYLGWVSENDLQNSLRYFSYLAPFLVLASIVSFYRSSSSMADFFRKYVFSVLIFVPMLIVYGDIQFIFWLSAVHLFSSVLSLYDVKPKNQSSNDFVLGALDRIKLAPAQIIIISFSGIILIGTLLLALPISAAPGKSIEFIDAFFTATSATCVTGLSTISLVDNFSFIGQIIVLLLLQIGGLGYMTLHSSMMILLGKSFAVKNQLMMQDVLDISSISDLIAMVVNIIKYTIVIELIGGIILAIAFTFEGYEYGQAIYLGFFHAISAFCNAGFALFNDSLVSFQTNPVINYTICGLIILGGLGFIVIKELELLFTGKKKIINLSVHSKIVLTTSFALTALVAVYIFFSEYLHGLSGMSFLDQIQISFFQSVTTRTAGFNTIGLNSLYPHTLYLMCLIMFIGASPGSTGGGIKTTTFAILFQSVKATLKGKDQVEFFDRRVSSYLVLKATALIVISLICVSFFILLMMRIETEHSFLSILFETISAFATVGLSLGITPYLSVAGKVIISILMFVGRIGPMTLVLAVGQRQQDDGHIDYPTGKVMIG